MEGYVKEISILETNALGEVLGIFLQGCNLNCPYCPKYDDRVFDEIYSMDIYELKKRSEEFNFENVLIYGAEPLVQSLFLIDILKLFRNKRIFILTNLTKINDLNEIIKSHKHLNFIIKWRSFDNMLFNRLTNARSFFQSEKIVLYDIIYGLNIIKKHSIFPWFQFTLIPGVFFTKEQIMEEVNFLMNFGFYPNIILSPLNIKNARGRWKNLNPVSESYLENLKEALKKEGYKVIIDPFLP